jgi:ADP-heptose:LPS heptosyltransferase
MTATVSYFKSGIGNLIVATPALQALASMDPSGKIDVCLAQKWKDSRVPAIRDILEACPFVDRVVEYPGRMNGGYSTHFIPLQCETSEAGKYIQARTKFNRIHWPGENWPATKRHEIDANMRLVRALGYGGRTPPLYVPIADEPVLDLPRPIIGVCNSAFGTSVWAKKHWPYFAPLADTLKRWFGGSVVGVGGARELSGVRLDEDFCGKLRFTETAKVISQVDLFISTDTGCMHAADALGVPMISLFGPTLTSKNAPVGSRSVALKSRTGCSPCQYTSMFHTCTVYLCMNSITPGEVMREARRMLS